MHDAYSAHVHAGPPLVYLTGFEPFAGHARNPSGELALALSAAPPQRLALLARVLPVSLERAPRAFDEGLAHAPRAPALILALGVHLGPELRLETRARASLGSNKRDEDGALAAGWLAPGPDERRCALALETAALALERAAPGRVCVSEDAGGFVCERLYHHALGRAQECGAAALFLHVPRVELMPLDEQAQAVRALLLELVPGS